MFLQDLGKVLDRALNTFRSRKVEFLTFIIKSMSESTHTLFRRDVDDATDSAHRPAHKYVRTMYDEVNRNNRTNEVGIEINGCVCVSLCQSSHTSALRRDCISSSLRRLVLMWIERILRSHEDDG